MEGLGASGIGKNGKMQNYCAVKMHVIFLPKAYY